MSEHQFAPLEEWMESIIDYRGKTPEKTTTGIPLITAKVIKGGRIETPSEFIAADAYDEWMRRGIPEAGDVVITTEAPLGEVAQLPKGKVALAQRVITLRGKKGLVDNTFLKYLLLSRPFQEDLEARATGTTVVGIKQSVLRKIDLDFPPFLDQKATAHILGTLDDKIELNRKTNETLEAMAKALFKSWFVDFDPVRAKAEGRPTGLPAEISDLFPDSFEDSELGEIPSGWKVFSLDQMLETISETMPLMEREKVVFLNTGDILNGEFLVSEYVSSRGLPGQAKKSIRKGDILFSEIRPGNGRHAFVCFDAYDYVVSTKLMVLRSRNRLDSLFEYFLITMSSSIQILKVLAESRSGTFPQITFSELSSVKYLLPVCRDLIDIFDAQFLRPFHERSTLLSHQNILLSQTRDALLPKLISGEIRIPDAEKMLEEVDI